MHWRRVVLTASSATVSTADDSLRRYRLTTDSMAKRMHFVGTTEATQAFDLAYTLSDSAVTLTSSAGESITLRRAQPTLLRWRHLWSW
jgi:hypothetical protein